ncbi:MAG: hypothetical protein LBV26_05365 [Bacteroidales bacterium]|nr:hypothetical protein [Bacteroidales bacterium]
MKTKQLLILLAFMPLFLSCKKDTDYRDGFEGTYTTEVTGNIVLVDDDGYIFPLSIVSDQITISVMTSSSRMLTLNIDGTIITPTVEENGVLSIPSESGKMSLEIDDAGTVFNTDNFTKSYTGTITDRMLQLKLTYSGTGTVTSKEGTYNSSVTGTIVYSGIK